MYYQVKTEMGSVGFFRLIIFRSRIDVLASLAFCVILPKV